MVPAVFLEVETFPLTPNGKLDRRAFPLPAERGLVREAPFEEPCTPLEQQVAAIWRTLLGAERVSRSDSFFKLGGHSLLVTQVTSRVEKLCKIEIPLHVLFEKPHLAAFVQAVLQFQQHQLEQLLTRLDTLSDEEVEALSVKKKFP
jgi:acyl carrier protein